MHSLEGLDISGRKCMAWTSQGEEIHATLLDYTSHLSPEKKVELKSIYAKAINPFQGEWTTMNQVIFVNLRNRENVLSNLKLAMLKEIRANDTVILIL